MQKNEEINTDIPRAQTMCQPILIDVGQPNPPHPF